MSHVASIDATPHHVGCAVGRLEDGIVAYSAPFGFHRRSRAFDVVSQHVRVCFIDLGNRFYLELIAPRDDKARLASFLRVGFYHMCFLVDDLVASREHLKAQRFHALPAFESEAFAGGLCQFFLSPQRHLIELAQMSMDDFGNFFAANLDDAAVPAGAEGRAGSGT